MFVFYYIVSISYYLRKIISKIVNMFKIGEHKLNNYYSFNKCPMAWSTVKYKFNKLLHTLFYYL